MTSPQLWPSLSIVTASLLWGGYWIPMRAMEAAGLLVAWPSLVLNGGVALVLLPGAVYLWRRFAANPADLMISGLTIGAGLSLYGISMNLTDVVRAVLLFYLSPVWSTVIGLIWLGERLSLQRCVALGCGIAGMMVVLKADMGLPVPQNTGDWLALAAGFAWSVGSARIFVGKTDGTYETVFAFTLGTVIVTAFFLMVFPSEIMGTPPDMESLVNSLPILGVGVFVLMLPILFLTVWGARRLPPATVGILLLGEIIVAVISAALLLPEEAFGAREILGGLLIASAGLVEVFPGRHKGGHKKDIA